MPTRRQVLLGGGVTLGVGLVGAAAWNLDAPMQHFDAGVEDEDWSLEVVDGDASVVVAAETLRDVSDEEPEAFEITIYFDREYRVGGEDMTVLSVSGRKVTLVGNAQTAPWDVEIEKPGLLGSALGAKPVTTLTLDAHRVD